MLAEFQSICTIWLWPLASSTSYNHAVEWLSQICAAIAHDRWLPFQRQYIANVLWIGGELSLPALLLLKVCSKLGIL